MGMYDTITVHEKVDLPGNRHHVKFQTKDLENMLYDYMIGEYGDLLLLNYDLEPVGEPTQHPFFKTWTDWQAHKRINERWISVPYHGDIDFYDYDSETKISHDYIARFTHDKLEWIKLIRTTDHSSTQITDTV